MKSTTVGASVFCRDWPVRCVKRVRAVLDAGAPQRAEALLFCVIETPICDFAAPRDAGPPNPLADGSTETGPRGYIASSRNEPAFDLAALPYDAAPGG